MGWIESRCIDLDRKATSANVFTVVTKIGRAGGLFHLTGVSGMCPDGNDRQVRIGVRRNEKTLYLRTLLLANDNYYYFASFDVVIPSSWQVVLRIEGHADGDMINLNVLGWLEFAGPERIAGD